MLVNAYQRDWERDHLLPIASTYKYIHLLCPLSHLFFFSCFTIALSRTTSSLPFCTEPQKHRLPGTIPSSLLTMYPSTSIPILLISAALPIFSYAAPQVPPSSSTTSSTTPAATPDGPYSIMALHSGTSLQFASLTAADQQFFFGGQTQSSCPEEIPEDCPPGNQTVFTPYGSLVSDYLPNHLASQPASSITFRFSPY